MRLAAADSQPWEAPDAALEALLLLQFDALPEGGDERLAWAALDGVCRVRLRPAEEEKLQGGLGMPGLVSWDWGRIKGKHNSKPLQ